MYYKGEIEEELRNIQYPWRMAWEFTSDSDVEDVMSQVLVEQSEEVYPHEPSKDCEARGYIYIHCIRK